MLRERPCKENEKYVPGKIVTQLTSGPGWYREENDTAVGKPAEALSSRRTCESGSVRAGGDAEKRDPSRVASAEGGGDGTRAADSGLAVSDGAEQAATA